MVAEIQAIAPEINIKHLAAPWGSLDAVLMHQMHCPNFNCDESNWEYEHVADVMNPSLKRLSKHFGGFRDTLPLDFRFFRLDHDGSSEHPPWIYLPPEVLQAMDDLDRSIYETSTSKVCVVHGRYSKRNYDTLFPRFECVTLNNAIPIFRGKTHMYIETSNGAVRRLTFVVFHPSAYRYGVAKPTAEFLDEITSVVNALVFRPDNAYITLQNDTILNANSRAKGVRNLDIDWRAYSRTPDCNALFLAARMRAIENRERRLFKREELPKQIVRSMRMLGRVFVEVVTNGAQLALPRVDTTVLEILWAVDIAASTITPSPFGSFVPLEDVKGQTTTRFSKISKTADVQPYTSNEQAAAQRDSLIVRAMEAAMMESDKYFPYPKNEQYSGGPDAYNLRATYAAWATAAGQHHLWDHVSRHWQGMRIKAACRTKAQVNARDSVDVLGNLATAQAIAAVVDSGKWRSPGREEDIYRVL